jgi:hypothetical protein
MSCVSEQSTVIPSGAASQGDSSRSTQNTSVPWYKYLEGPGDLAGVRPSGVKLVQRDGKVVGWEAKQPGKQAWRGFSKEEKDQAYQHAEISLTTCPIDGRSIPYGVDQIQTLVNYLRIEHSGEFERLKRNSSGGKITELYVYPDCYSTTRRFINHRFTGISFETKEELDLALKNGYQMFPEFDCRFGNACHGIAGGCDYNHPGVGWCMHEKGPKSRCHSKFCKFNHGRGRVKFAITNKENSATKPVKQVKAVKSAQKDKPSVSKPTNMFEGLISDDEEEVEAPKVEEVEAPKVKEVEAPKVEEVEAPKDEDDGFRTPGRKRVQKTPPAPKKAAFQKKVGKQNVSKQLFPADSQADMEVVCTVLTPEDVKMPVHPKGKGKKPFNKAPGTPIHTKDFPNLSENSDASNQTPSWKEKIEETKALDAEKERQIQQRKIEEHREKLRREQELLEQERLLAEKQLLEEREAIQAEEEKKQQLQAKLDEGVAGLTRIVPKKERDVDEPIQKKGSKKAKKKGTVLLSFGGAI